MKTKDLANLKKEKTAQQIIYLHCHNKIFLTNKQIDSLIKEKNKNKSEIILN